MARTGDGLLAPLSPNWLGLALGAGVIAAGIGAAVASLWLVAVPCWLVGLVQLLNAYGGEQRLRVTASKLLIETSRPVRGLIIGPVRQRVPWPELQGASVEGGALKVERAGGAPLFVCHGLPEAELKEVVERLERKRAEQG